MTDGADEQAWDVAVVGAGPAGATAALAVLASDPGARVLLLDRDDFPRDKCCGDGIAPHALDVLAGLGVHDLVEGWEPVQRLDLSRAGTTVEGRLDRPAYVVPRAVLDARLVERAVAAGAVLRRHRVREVHPSADGVLLDGQVRAQVVVGADGDRSVVRRALGVGLEGHRALAIRGYGPTPPGRRGRQVIRFGERRQPAYAWSFDRGDGRSNIGYGELVGSGAELSRALLLEQLEELIPGAVATGGDWRAHHLPLSGWGRGTAQPDGRVLLVGDAAGLVNPMTGEGIYYAVATGALAGRLAADGVRAGRPELAGARHGRAVTALLGTHLKHTWTAARLSRHPRIVRAGLAAAGRDPRVFDDLVELGLGDGRLTPRLVRGLGHQLLAPAGHRKG